LEDRYVAPVQPPALECVVVAGEPVTGEGVGGRLLAGEVDESAGAVSPQAEADDAELTVPEVEKVGGRPSGAVSVVDSDPGDVGTAAGQLGGPGLVDDHER
jgi:hypothetical protein